MDKPPLPAGRAKFRVTLHTNDILVVSADGWTISGRFLTFFVVVKTPAPEPNWFQRWRGIIPEPQSHELQRHMIALDSVRDVKMYELDGRLFGGE